MIPWGSQVAQMIKNLPANAEDARYAGSVSGSGTSPAEGNGNPLQYSCLENPMDRGGWQSTVHGGRTESDTTERLSPHISDSSEGFRKWFLVLNTVFSGSRGNSDIVYHKHFI